MSRPELKLIDHTFSSRWSRSHEVTTLWNASSSTLLDAQEGLQKCSPSSARTGWQAVKPVERFLHGARQRACPACRHCRPLPANVRSCPRCRDSRRTATPAIARYGLASAPGSRFSTRRAFFVRVRHAQAAGAVVARPFDIGRRAVVRPHAAERIHVGRQQRRDLGQIFLQAADEMAERRAVARRRRRQTDCCRSLRRPPTYADAWSCRHAWPWAWP